MKQKTFPVQGMHCASCASIIKRKLEKLEGVESCVVNFGTEKAAITFDPQKVTPQAMNHEIDALGYHLMGDQTDMSKQGDRSMHEGHDMMPVSSDAVVKEQKLRELNKLRNHVKIVLPMVAVSVISMAWEMLRAPEVVMEFFHHLLPVFATYALFVVGVPYLKGIVRFVKYRVANMDSLVGIGTTVAFLYSFIVTAFETVLAPYINVSENYYDVTIVVIGFITLGKFLEARSKLKTGEAIEKLLSLQAKKAVVLRQGKEIEIGIDEVVVGDVAIVKPGQKVPLDGVIVDGNSSLDESMITGESLPVDKKPGDEVIGATINKQGYLKVRISKVGANTMLSQIIKMVEEAQGSKAPIERLADQVSAVFVPSVIVFASVVFVLWLAVGSQFMPLPQALTLGIVSTVGILVIACPCAMGLATPTAVIVGVGKAAENGILIKNAEGLERLSGVNFVVMDKTGTLTKGKPEVTDVIAPGTVGEREMLELVASLENRSEHPLGQAIVRYAREKKVKLREVEDFKALEGKGLKGTILKKEYFAGNVRLATDLKLTVDEKIIRRFSGQGKTPVLVMTKKTIFGYIAIADTLKEEARDVVQELHQLQIKVAMLTGDHKETAAHIARQLGIDEVVAEVLPADKAGVIKKLKRDGHIVAMVGDGINDAPALATSDVGIAMGTGTDVAIESAGITLLGGHIAKVPAAIRLARKTMRTIKQNLFWAFVYNIVGIPVAAGALYPFFGILLNPAIAGAAMAFSSVSVVVNSLRLKTTRVVSQ